LGKGGWENPLATRSTRSPIRVQTPYFPDPRLIFAYRIKTWHALVRLGLRQSVTG